ncbi:MAG: dihydropteroate synthase [Bacteroidota bacterium]
MRGKIIDLTIPKVMGILNVTPDSFYDGGLYHRESDLLRQTEKMLLDGADFIDLGGYSSRPNAEDISVTEEWSRVKPAIQSIKKEFPSALLSIDTFRSQVARPAIGEGCDMINDISAGQLDQEMFQTVADLHVPYVIMHMRGTPQTMTQLTQYDHLIKEVIDYFHQILHQLNQLGVNDVLVDPGFGFAKTIDQNFELLNGLEQFHILDKPMLIGLSRKSMIWKTLNTTPEFALNGTTSLNTVALLKGAAILRVHDVKEAKETIQLLSKMKSSE